MRIKTLCFFDILKFTYMTYLLRFGEIGIFDIWLVRHWNLLIFPALRTYFLLTQHIIHIYKQPRSLIPSYFCPYAVSLYSYGSTSLGTANMYWSSRQVRMLRSVLRPRPFPRKTLSRQSLCYQDVFQVVSMFVARTVNETVVPVFDGGSTDDY
jgi:hypothetical protein